MNNLLRITGSVGMQVLQVLTNIGKLTLLTGAAILGIFRSPFYIRIFIQQFLNIGFYSLPLIGLTALFSGAVLALQTHSGFAKLSAESTVPTIIILSITRELSSVLSGLVIAGKAGASIAAEIASMRVTEQIDALYTLSTNPIKYLVTPRILATTISMPLLVLVADILGVLGGYLVCTQQLGFDEAAYMHNSFSDIKYIDVILGLTKATFFGFIIGCVSCFYGFHASNGAQGVGKATTQSVVHASVLILLSNYFITKLFV